MIHYVQRLERIINPSMALEAECRLERQVVSALQVHLVFVKGIAFTPGLKDKAS
ncbi:hypothetical protein [Nonomuraea sp. NPDC005650]|uniref:hypothetical protein n=1 Tax=Nonomuraea sp. NPDC005650 TaxID=3157045 RepID=UPI0033ABD6E5